MKTKRYLVRIVKVDGKRIKSSEQTVVINTSKKAATSEVLSSKDNTWQLYSVDILK